MNTTAHAHDTLLPVTGSRAARADAGAVRLRQRDIDGLILCAEHYAAPYDLLAAALRRAAGPAARDHRAVARAGYAATGRLGPARPGAG